MSVPQIPHAATLIKTSLRPTSGTGTSSTRTMPFSRYTPARMVLGTGVAPDLALVSRLDAVLTAAILVCDPPRSPKRPPTRALPRCVAHLRPAPEENDPENPPKLWLRRGYDGRSGSA